MFEEVIELIGEEEGQTSIILAGVHGNEKCGVEAFKEIIPNLKIAKGSVLFIYGNPKAIESNQRFVEANLNRMFRDDDLLSGVEKKTYEYGRANFLKKYFNQAGALLDIHASFTPKSKSFIICEEGAEKIASYLPFNLVVSGFYDLEPGGTDWYMKANGKIGICVECGYLGDSESSRIAKESVFAFLKICGHLPNDLSPQEQSHIHMNYLYKTKTNNFTLSKAFDDFEEVSKGQVVGMDGKREVIIKDDGIILFARNRKQVNDEAFLLGKKI